MLSLFIKHILPKTINLRTMRWSWIQTYFSREQEYQIKVFSLVFAFTMINCKKNKLYL